MSTFQCRPSILLRPKKAANPESAHVATQHLELEHQKEEARLNLKRDQRLAREHVRGQQLWGSASDKAELAAAERREHEAQRDARRRAEEAERAERARLQACMKHSEAASRRAELAKIEAKKEYLQQLRNDNYQLAEQRKHIAAHQREEEKTTAAQNATQPNFLSKFGRHAF